MRTDCLKIVGFVVKCPALWDISMGGPVDCAVTVTLQCGLRIDGRVTCDGQLNPNWSTLNPIKVASTFGA